jgi:hypothetical protein
MAIKSGEAVMKISVSEFKMKYLLDAINLAVN